MISFAYTLLDFKNCCQYNDGVKQSTYLLASVGQGFAVMLQQDPSKSQWPPKDAAVCPPCSLPWAVWSQPPWHTSWGLADLLVSYFTELKQWKIIPLLKEYDQWSASSCP